MDTCPTCGNEMEDFGLQCAFCTEEHSVRHKALATLAQCVRFWASGARSDEQLRHDLDDLDATYKAHPIR